MSATTPGLTPEQLAALKALREPFGPEDINKLPKVPKTIQQDSAVRKENCTVCAGWHKQGPGVVHLDYAGHAVVTARFLDVDPGWNWEPYAHNPDGTPALEVDEKGNPIGLWIKLTIAGMTRPGYGSIDSVKSDAVKELIGDALRNAAMRFGVALDLWKKDVGGSDYDQPAPQRAQRAQSSPRAKDAPEWVAEMMQRTESTSARILSAARRIDAEARSLGDIESFTPGQRIELEQRLTPKGHAEPAPQADPPPEDDVATKAAAAAESWGNPGEPDPRLPQGAI